MTILGGAQLKKKGNRYEVEQGKFQLDIKTILPHESV